MTKKKTPKEKHPLRLIRWSNDNYPPIDLSNEFPAVLELVKAYKELEKQVNVDYNLVPLLDIDEEARKIAVAWVDGFDPGSGIDILNKQKLASDIINYAANRVLIRTKQYQTQIDQLLIELEQQRQLIKELQKVVNVNKEG